MQNGVAMARPQSALAEQANAGQHAQWIAGRVETLLSHYFQPDNPSEVLEAAVDDWIAALLSKSQAAIRHGCETYLRDQPRRRPTPGDILHRVVAFESARVPKRVAECEGDRNSLTSDELMLLDDKVLPTARDWVANKPGLCVHGARTLAYWGERISLFDAQRIRRDWKVVMPAELVDQPAAFKAWLAEITNSEQPEVAK